MREASLKLPETVELKQRDIKMILAIDLYRMGKVLIGHATEKVPSLIEKVTPLFKKVLPHVEKCLL